MKCQHQWTANHENSQDYGYHCELCGFDPSGEHSLKNAARHRAAQDRLFSIALKMALIFVLPALLGFYFFGVPGAAIGGVVSFFASVTMFAAGACFGSVLIFFEN